VFVKNNVRPGAEESFAYGFLNLLTFYMVPNAYLIPVNIPGNH
jgi:hypothetical protein